MAGTFTCGHCGKDHDEGIKFCPETGKSLGPAAGAKKTMMMFQQPGAKSPGSTVPAGPPGRTPTPAGASPPSGTPRLQSTGGVPVVAALNMTPSGGIPRASTPSAGIPRASTPSAGIPAPVGSRPSGRVQIPLPSPSPKEVPPPPVASDGVPPPPVPGAVENVPSGATSGASGARRKKSVPDWVGAPQAGGGGSIPSSVLPAVDAPEKGVADLLKDAVALYRQHAKVFLVTAAILFVPGAIISSLALALIQAPIVAAAATAADGSATLTTEVAMGGLLLGLLGLLGWAVVAFILYGLIVPLTSGALTIAVADRVLGGERDWRDYWRMLLSRLGMLISAVVPAALLTAIGFFLFVIPGVALAFFFAFVPTVVLVEGLGGVAALKRSFQLVKSDWLRVALVFITFGVINFVGHKVGGLFVPDQLDLPEHADGRHGHPGAATGARAGGGAAVPGHSPQEGGL